MFDLSGDMDCATAPFIDPTSLGLPAFRSKPAPPPAMAPRVAWNSRDAMPSARTPEPPPLPREVAAALPPSLPVPETPVSEPRAADEAPALARDVEWDPKPQIAPARPPEPPTPLTEPAALAPSSPPVEPGIVPDVMPPDNQAQRHAPEGHDTPAGDLFIDPSELYLHAPLRTQAILQEEGPQCARTIDTDYVVLAAPEPEPAPPTLAGSVKWEARSRMSPARPSGHRAAVPEGALRAESTAYAPAAVACAEPADTALALAPSVNIPTEPFVIRTLALLDQCNPLPWTSATPALAQPWQNFTPDHRSVLGMESDLLHLLQALRQSPDVPLLDGGQENGPLPARLEDLQYVPEPKGLSSAVEWKPVVRPALSPAVALEIPAEARKWPGRRGHLPHTESSCDQGLDLGPRAEKLFRLWVRPERRPPANGRTAGIVSRAVTGGHSTSVRMPASLQGFHENGLMARAPMRRLRHRTPVPSWMVSLLTALIIILISTWVLEKSAFDRFSFTHVEASSAASTDAAQSAFPTMSKYVEVTGVRASDDGKTKSDIRYVVVNHSQSDLPPFVLSVKLHPRRGNTTLASFSATMPGLAASESRELRATVARDPHSFDLPEWRDLRVESHVTAKP